MRLRPFLLILALGLAAPAAAQQSGAPTPVLPAPAPAPAADVQRCRTTCASSYYFCLSTDAAEDCAPSWMQCRNACEAAARRQSVSALPPRP
jgi:hypothetical protein